jgi:hypothetical protein
MVLEMTSGSVKLEIPVPAQVLEAASTMAEAFSSMQGSTRLSPLSTLVQIPPGSLKSFWPSALVFIPVAGLPRQNEHVFHLDATQTRQRAWAQAQQRSRASLCSKRRSSFPSSRLQTALM